MPRTSSRVLPALLLAACAGDEIAAPASIVPVTHSAVRAAEIQSLAATVTVIMSGLDAPRGLAWGPKGALYVAEAGTSAINGPCASVVRGSNCYSGTGAVTRWWKGRQERVASGLPSTFTAAVRDIAGPQDIAFLGSRAFVSIGWGGAPAARAQLGDFATGLGWMIQLTPSGRWREVADVASAPAGGPSDTNPFGLHAEPGRRFVADAGANSLIEVKANREVSVVASFPPTPAPAPFGQSEAVPTEVERGPDGALYVSTLSGAPFLIGAAKIYRVVPGETPVVYADGFKTITDFAFGPDGSLYVLEYASAPMFFGGPGRVVHVALNGTRTIITNALTNPTGIILDGDGIIYVSNRGNVASVGEVLRIVP